MNTREYLRAQRKLIQRYPYKLTYWKDFDFSALPDLIMVKAKGGRKGITYNDLIIMADTETSKKPLQKDDNHIVAWSICFRAYHHNIATLWGQNPYEFCDMISELRKNLAGREIYIYFHNLGYDWVFLRKFLIERMGEPDNQLNLKSYAPLFVKFSNGIVLKDSLVLAARKLERWAKDLDVEHKKALGKWDYNKYRNQSDILTDDELLYIENDVRAGVECLDATLSLLKKNISSIPYTSTGIMRGECRDVGKKNKAHNKYESMAPDYKLQQILEIVFHGGYTHANRYCTVRGVNHGIYNAICYDFSSSYPYCMLAYKYPIEKFWPLEKTFDNPDYILKNSKDYAMIIHAVFVNIKLKDPRFPMPCLSMFKASAIINGIADNGRCMEASLYECYITEVDLELIAKYYKWDSCQFDNIYIAFKDYLPTWFSDIIYKEYKAKCELKGVDDILYALEKGKFNSLFGMCVQHPVSMDIKEDYKTGEYASDAASFWDNFEENYNKHVKNKNSFLPYQWGVWVTAYAQRNLFELGECVDYDNGGIWLYSDTDSCYATKFDEKKISAYNEKCKKLLSDHGYSGVRVKGKEYNLGVAEFDGEYMQFKTLHSKCYCDRPLTARGDTFVMGGDLQITVAGVPKKGAECLKNNIENFKAFFTFDGLTTKKLGHTHITVDKIYTDKNGNITGDSIDLKPCDYIMTDLDRANILYTDYMEVEQDLAGYEDFEQFSFFDSDVMSVF